MQKQQIEELLVLLNNIETRGYNQAAIVVQMSQILKEELKNVNSTQKT